MYVYCAYPPMYTIQNNRHIV